MSSGICAGTGDSQVIPEHKNPGSEADPCVLSLAWMPKNSPSQDLVKMRIDFRYRVFLQPPLGISFSNVSSYIQMHLKYIFLQLCFFSVCVIPGLGVTRSMSLSSGQEAVCKSGQSQLCVTLENLFNLHCSAGAYTRGPGRCVMWSCRLRLAIRVTHVPTRSIVGSFIKRNLYYMSSLSLISCPCLLNLNAAQFPGEWLCGMTLGPFHVLFLVPECPFPFLQCISCSFFINLGSVSLHWGNLLWPSGPI